MAAPIPPDRTVAHRSPLVDRVRRFWRRSGFVALSLALLGLGALLHAACEGRRSQAAPAKSTGSTEVLAKVDDVVITVGDFQNRINQQSPYVRARYTSLERKKEFLDNLVRFEVLAHEAQVRGLQNDEEVVRTMKQVMIQKLMKEQFDASGKPDDVSDAEAQTYYNAHPEEYNKPEEVRVADILVKDEKAARKVIADPRVKGVDNAGFRALVAEYSQDAATKDRGGDLRYFDRATKDFPAEIVSAAFALQNLGDVSEPVRVGSGLHVIKLIGRRKALVRSFDEVKAQIKSRLYRDKRQQAMEDFVKRLRDKAKIGIHEDRFAKVAIDTGNGGSPNLASPTSSTFHPGSGGLPSSTPAVPVAPGSPPSLPLPVAPGHAVPGLPANAGAPAAPSAAE